MALANRPLTAPPSTTHPWELAQRDCFGDLQHGHGIAEPSKKTQLEAPASESPPEPDEHQPSRNKRTEPIENQRLHPQEPAGNPRKHTQRHTPCLGGKEHVERLKQYHQHAP
eukprot:scaffold19075_cov92-Cylindrotheca_fusiformis.AAC.2